MNPNQFLTLEWAFGILVSIAITALWRFVNAQAEAYKVLTLEIKSLNEKLHNVEKTYQSKSDARETRKEIIDLLNEIKTDLKKVNEKLDQKADKS